MTKPLLLHADRLFPTEKTTGNICRELYEEVVDLPIISPHGHTDPRWFAQNDAFSNPAELLLIPDHYVLRMLYSQGIPMQSLGVKPSDGSPFEQDPRKIWHLFGQHYHLFRGTPSHIWMNYVFGKVFGIEVELDEHTANDYYDIINDKLKLESFRPRSLFDKYNIELISTTESPLDDLAYHRDIARSDWTGKVISAFRPDPVVDPDFEGFNDNIAALARICDIDCSDFSGYLMALKARRKFFKSTGVTATDHGHPTAQTADLSLSECQALYNKVRAKQVLAQDAELFRAQMLTEMAKMSIEDGLVMQIHPGSHRNHNFQLFKTFGRDKGADIPKQTSYVDQLKPLLSKYGNRNDLTIILFTLDETAYSRELAPLAGHYPCLRLGPPWWFHDSPEGMRRFREQVTETAGFYNTVGFNDDTRAFLSIPARHDVARRMDCHFLATLVAQHRISRADASELAKNLAYDLVKKAYKL